MAGKRPEINNEVERQVREKCNFACVMCGCTIYDYDHIDDWSEVQEHRVENLTLLCTLHHRLKNKGILSKEVIRDRTENIRHKPNGGLPDLNLPKCSLIIGNNTVDSGFPSLCFCIRNRDYFHLNYDTNLNQVVINAAFFDNNGIEIFTINDNIYDHTREAWDVQTKGNSIIIKEGFRKRIFIVTLDSVNNSIIIKGKLFTSKGKAIIINDSGIHFGKDNHVSNNKFMYYKVGVYISNWNEFKPPHAAAYFSSKASGSIISDSNFMGNGCGIAIDSELW